MTDKDDTIRMAREAGLHSAALLHLYGGKESALTYGKRDELRRLRRFAALVAERDTALLRQALEALTSKYIVNSGAWRVQQDQAIAALRERLGEKT